MSTTFPRPRAKLRGKLELSDVRPFRNTFVNGAGELAAHHGAVRVHTRLFVSDRQAQLTRQVVNYIVRLAGEKAKLGRAWPHMLGHSYGYYVANKGTDLRTMQDLPRAPGPQTHGALYPGCRATGLKVCGDIERV